MNSSVRKYSGLVFGLAVFAGLPLLAWGPGDIHAFFSLPLRTAYFSVTVLSILLVVFFVPNAGQSVKAGEEVVARQRYAVPLLQLFPLGILVLAPYSDRHHWLVLPESQWIRILGLALFLGGTVLMNWAAVALGRHFSIQVTVQKDHRLVTSGPFRLVRHPRYLGIAVCFFGTALVFESVAGLVLALLLLLVLFWRIHDEETFMAAHFPDEWPTYAARTARLVPFVF